MALKNGYDGYSVDNELRCTLDEVSIFLLDLCIFNRNSRK